MKCSTVYTKAIQTNIKFFKAFVELGFKKKLNAYRMKMVFHNNVSSHSGEYK